MFPGAPMIPATFMRSVSKLGLSIRRIVTTTTTTTTSESHPHVSIVDKPHVLFPMRVLSLNVRGLGSLGKVSWVKELKRMEYPSVIGLQETKIKDVDDALLRGLWNGCDFGFAKSGGILTIWCANVFVRKQTIQGLGFLAVVGDWIGIKGNVGFINVHGPHIHAEKKLLWNRLLSVMAMVDAAWCVFGDFNEVTSSVERRNTQVNRTSVADFNDFIRNSYLIDLPMDGRKFTRVDDNALKFSKLDRFLVSQVFLGLWPSLVVEALDRKLSDHCPIVLKTRDVDIGRKLCHPYYVCLSEADVGDVVKRAWNMDVTSTVSDDVFRDRLNNVKLELKKRNRLKFGIVDNELELLTKEVSAWELEAENRPLSDIELKKWKDARKQWIEKDKSLGIGSTKVRGSTKIRDCKWTHIVTREVRDFAWRLQKGYDPPPRTWRIGNFDKDKLCSCCGDALQTIDHCIIQCTYNASVWSSVFQWWNLGCFDGTSVSDVLYHKDTASFPKKQKLLWTAVFWSTAYIIWTYGANPTPSQNKNVIYVNTLTGIQSRTHTWISQRFKDFGFSWSEWCSNPSSRNA